MQAEDLTDLRIIAEPGRTITGPLGISVMSVIGKRWIEGNLSTAPSLRI